MSKLDEIHVASWECVCALRTAYTHTDLPVVRAAMIERALGHAERAYGAHLAALEESDAKAERGEVAA